MGSKASVVLHTHITKKKNLHVSMLSIGYECTEVFVILDIDVAYLL